MKDPAPEPWGGEPLPPAEEPWPEDHPMRRLLEPSPPPPDPSGRLGGLLGGESLSTRSFALAWTLWQVGIGALLLGAFTSSWSIHAADLHLSGKVAPLLGGGCLLLAVSLGPRSLRGWGLALTLGALAWTGASAMGRWSAPLAWTFAPLCLIALLRLGGPPSEQSALLRSSWRAPHHLSQALAAAGSLLGGAALVLDTTQDMSTLLLRLTALGVIAQGVLLQRALLSPAPLPRAQRAALALRAGRWSKAYRWVLWLGVLTPLVLLGCGLVVAALGPAARAALPLFVVPSLLAWHHLHALNSAPDVGDIAPPPGED